MSKLSKILRRAGGGGELKQLKWSEEFLKISTGAAVFSYEFDQNYNDSSGLDRHLIGGGSGYDFSENDPNKQGGFSIRRGTGNNLAVPSTGIVLNNNSRTLIAIVRPIESSFVSSSTICYMGGGDTGSSGAYYAFGLGFANNTTNPRLRIDYNRNVTDINIPVSYINSWLSIVVTHDGTAPMQKVYVQAQGEDEHTLLSQTSFTLNTTIYGSNSGNYLGRWANIRYFTGDIAYIGLRTEVIPDSQIKKFKIL
jgi:hypothetical protein